MLECKEGSLYSRLGRRRVMKIVWQAIPWQFRLLGFPYYLPIYSRLLAGCDSVSALKKVHTDLYDNRTLFWIFRPRYRLMKAALTSLEVERNDATKHEGAEGSVTSGLSDRVPIGIESTPAPSEHEHECTQV